MEIANLRKCRKAAWVMKTPQQWIIHRRNADNLSHGQIQVAKQSCWPSAPDCHCSYTIAERFRAFALALLPKCNIRAQGLQRFATECISKQEGSPEAVQCQATMLYDGPSHISAFQALPFVGLRVFPTMTFRFCTATIHYLKAA